MTITYPLVFPTIGIVQSTWRGRFIIGESESIFTGATQTYKHQGEWWEGEVTFRPMNHAQAGQVKAFLMSLRGKFGTFLYGDPDYLAKGANGALGGTPLVDGIVAARARTLPTKGWTPFTTVLLKGDYIQLGSGATSRLYIVQEDVNTDSAGYADISIGPGLRVAAANNDAITVVAPKTVMKMVDNSVEWNSNQSSIVQAVIAFRESLTI